jgi:hypothetical protein
MLKNLISRDKAADKTINDLLKALRDHLSPKPSVIVEMFRFHQRNQRPGESVLSFMAELRNLAAHCQFGASLNDTLRDMLVVRLRNETTQKQLLSETDLDLEKGINLSAAIETAANDAAEVQGVRGEYVHSIRSISTRPKGEFNKKLTPKHTNTKPNAQKPICYRCDGGHLATQCKHVNTVCSFCRTIGHIERACLKKKRDKNKGYKTALHYDEEDKHDSENNGEPHLHITSTFHMRSKHEARITVRPAIESSHRDGSRHRDSNVCDFQA